MGIEGHLGESIACHRQVMELLSILIFIKFIYGVMMNVTHEPSRKVVMVVLALFGHAGFGHLLRCAQQRALPAGCDVSPLPGTAGPSAVPRVPSAIFWFRYRVEALSKPELGLGVMDVTMAVLPFAVLRTRKPRALGSSLSVTRNEFSSPRSNCCLRCVE